MLAPTRTPFALLRACHRDSMLRISSFLTALLLLLVCGLLHGLWAERWQKSQDLEAALARVPEVPMTFGDWKGRGVEGEAAAFRQAGAQAYWMRTYFHERRKLSLLVILMCGRAGRMAVHTPEVCYRGAGYEIDDAPARLTVTSAQGHDLGDFWGARFAKPGGVGSQLRLLWAWSAEGMWQAPDAPRWQFRGQPFLYKLYISHDGPDSSPSAGDPTLEFLRDLLPELDRALFASKP